MAAVFHRGSLAVASLEATERFGVGPAALGTFTVLQLLVYAAMQVPTGLLVDRFGPRKVLVTAALLMGAGQVLFALATSYPLGLIARAVLGFGDAMTFISLLRVASAHFSARQYSLVVSVTAALGGLGNLAATVPLTLLLHNAGWTTTFLITGLATAGYALVASRLKDTPDGPAPRGELMKFRVVARNVRDTWRTPGTRLGFWVHFATMQFPAVLALLWGFPYLVTAHGLSEPAASSVLGVMVIVTITSGPLIGAVIGRRPELRMFLIAGYHVVGLGLWAVLLISPFPPVLLGVVFGVIALGLPLSAIGFTIARDYNPLTRVGTASGVVNVGGFLAATVAALGIGVVLDITDSYTYALLVPGALMALGIWRTAVWWLRARAEVFAAQARGEDVPVRIRQRRWDTVSLSA
ncbi:MFS transporter [Kibdelosporangium philippinense]|uniref:Lysosomal dipeptide transporter MFSD1 n=1 Tax=Kibdelosporangium philippinense TaxID=211113 RepID=A0ABS8ZLU6_9PSEU|nr:MFS transporter [Kibdelosporangium philippinense]MCE7007601.1 MFS transporter [Kibdelosporangium philippinense]